MSESYKSSCRQGKTQLCPVHETDLVIAQRQAGDILSARMNSLTPAFEPEADARPDQDVDVPQLDESRGLWSYRVALLFVGLYYIRPQDWVPGMAGFNIIRPVMLMWGVALMAEGLNSPLRGFFRTPHDWVMAIFYGYVVWNAPSDAGAGMGMFSLVVFYYLTTQSLGSWAKLLGYLRLWNWLLVITAAFGVLQLFGVDITGGADETLYNRGRLALGTWICNNPNGLGHTVAAAMPLSYMMFFWRSSAFSRIVLFPAAIALIVTCAWQTQSKGSFLVGAGLSVLIFVVGRPKWVQILVLSSAMTVGVGALSFMPRMESMGSLRTEEGVMGRLMAWENAHQSMERNFTGAGWRQFLAWITFLDESGRLITEPKSTHSSYIQIGADLGQPGIYLWLLILFCTFRSVAFYKARDEIQERCRRAVLLILIAYMISSWMINREYHTEYYLIAAIGAAFHRLVIADAIRPASEGGAGDEDDAVPKNFEWTLPSYEQASWLNPADGAPTTVTRKLWMSLDWKDFLAAGAGTWLVLYIWEYVLRNL